MDLVTSFEPGEPAPAPRPAGGHGAELRCVVGDGPARAYTARTGVGWTGRHALRYHGTHTAAGTGRAAVTLFDVHIPVGPDTTLSYLVFPEFPAAEQPDHRATHVAVDLRFDDGTLLSDLGAVDQHGFGVGAAQVGAARSRYCEQWNRTACRVGEVAAGRTVTEVLLSYRHPDGPGEFGGWLDDLGIRAEPAPRPASPAEHVRTTRGTNSGGRFSRGNTIPVTALPNGFNFWLPVTNARTRNWPYAYQSDNNADNLPELQAIAVSHAPSPWMGDRNTFHVLPTTQPDLPDPDPAVRALAFSHEDELDRPHHYRVRCLAGVTIEVAPADHAALLRFTVPGPDVAVIFSNVNRRGRYRVDVPTGVVTGYSDVRSGHSHGASRMYFYAVFDRPMTDGGRIARFPWRAQPAFARFAPDPSGETVLTIRVATSLISVEQARHNLRLEVSDVDTLESVRDRARAAWDEVLGRVEVDGATPDQLATLYGNLYRLHLYPNSGFENTGSTAEPVHHHANPYGPRRRSTARRTGTEVKPGKLHVNNGFWDTYRTAWPAYALFAPDRAGALVDGFVQHFRDGGWISRWSAPGYANLMTGTSSDVAFADAHLKGVTGFDVPAAYRAALRNATVVAPNSRVGRKGLHRSIFLGYTPVRTDQALSWTLEGCVNDFGIANLAAALGDRDAEVYFRGRALHYAHSFDERIGFFQGRTDTGAWRCTPQEHDPTAWGGDYVETDAWNTAFSVPHDGAGLAALHGGPDALAAKLDQLFQVPETGCNLGAYAGVVHEMREARDLRMGQYGHSNQPSHHIAWMYAHAGKPWRTQEVVREVLTRTYLGSEIGQGYCGDEDNGELSAWWLFAALGLYPLQVGSPRYVLGAPLFRHARLRLPAGAVLTVNAPANSPANKYVQSLRVNGKRHNRSWISHDVLAAGAVLDFELGPQPSRWAASAAAAPPSLSTGRPHPPRDVTATAGVRASPARRPAALTDDTALTETRFTDPDAWVSFTLTEPATVGCYTITSGGRGGADPTGWVLQGCDDGTSWVEVDARAGEQFAWRRQTRPFALAEPVRHKHFRLRFTGTRAPVVAQLELLAVD